MSKQNIKSRGDNRLHLIIDFLITSIKTNSVWLCLLAINKNSVYIVLESAKL